VLVQCLLHQLAAKNYISDQQCAEFLCDVHNIAETARQDCDKNRSLEEEVWLVSFTVIRNTQIHTRLTALLTGIARVSWFQKGKTNLDFTEQQTVSGSGITWAICKSAPCSRQITTPAPHHSVFYRPGALPVAQPTASKHCN